jgi:hypothetical protein
MKSTSLIGFEVLRMMTLKNVVIWVVMLNYMKKRLFFRALIFQSDNYAEKASHNSEIY